MPYSKPSQAPAYVPKEKRKQWIAVFNSAWDRAKADGKSDAQAESSAFAQANGVAGPSSKAAGESVNMSDVKELFAQICKRDDSNQTVTGFLVAETPDLVDEIFDYDSSKGYFKAWNAKFTEKTDGDSVGNLRSMHNKIAAGKFTSMDYEDDAKRIFVTAKVVDMDEWEKVRENVYTGFSIGAKYVRKWRDGKFTRWTGDPYEGSLVDNPAIPDCSFVHKYADGHEEVEKFPPAKVIPAEKGMGRISHLAQTLDSLNGALEMADYEHQATGRKSEALGRLHSHARHLHDAFAAYTQEQVDEQKKQHTGKTISQEEIDMDKQLLEKFVQLRNQTDELIKAATKQAEEAAKEHQADHSAEDCKDADCPFHGKSKGAIPGGSGGPDTGSQGAPSVGSPKETESSNAHWPGKAAVAQIDDALKGYSARLEKIEELSNETAQLVLKISEQLVPSKVAKTSLVTKAADAGESDARKTAVAEIEKLRESDPTAAATLAIKMAQENPRFLVGGARLLPAPAQNRQ